MIPIAVNVGSALDSMLELPDLPTSVVCKCDVFVRLLQSIGAVCVCKVFGAGNRSR